MANSIPWTTAQASVCGVAGVLVVRGVRVCGVAVSACCEGCESVWGCCECLL